ncbi:MAG: hypothetical protein JWO79_3532 [Actinomycetia bacterium]|nr:hypothetical protein [Actinomycetes bacterium]MDQ1652814.1 hypothetical protein [Cryptosporangiaceae bacterium]
MHTSQDPIFTRQTVNLALRSRDLHARTTRGHCAHCPRSATWPCAHFTTAQRVLELIAAQADGELGRALARAPRSARPAPTARCSGRRGRHRAVARGIARVPTLPSPPTHLTPT